ncbi:CopD family protein [Crenobacter cavernae]|uniref:Protoporphyrinogen IX oxidase n=1 Tax=Crenobacter cavernae TaxID=2290923 RepID=A0A345Y4U4_9NEIS|nr:CopD family protein [Crenobacter cavernae]AXK38946.1 CopD family protein [Crenobacter cavernae]
MSYALLKTLHIGFVVSWFAGLFYLPRLFVNLAMAETDAERTRLLLMAHKLFRFMTPLAVLAALFGVWLMFSTGFSGGWLHAKLALVAVLIGYHAGCGRLLAAFDAGRNRHGHRWYRVFNEIPVLVMFVVIYLVVAKPF